MELHTVEDFQQEQEQQELSQPLFATGDKVTAFGNKGVVKSISSNGLFLLVKFEDFDSIVIFNIDGKQTAWHKEASLKKEE